MGHHHKKFNFIHLTKQIGHDVGNGSKEIFKTGKHLVQAPEKLMTQTIDKASHFADNFGMPLIIVAGVIGVAMIMRK